MKEELIKFETAKLATEVGFDIETLHFYTKPNSKMFGIDEHGMYYPIKNWPKKLYKSGEEAVLNIKNIYFAPTQSLIQKWLREIHGIQIVVWWRDKEDKFYYEIGYSKGNVRQVQTGNRDLLFNSYEEALEEAIVYSLNFIKTKNG